MSDSHSRMIRYDSIDFLKGIACIAVVLIHFPLPGKVGFAVRYAGRFAVPFFFAVSGFFFANAPGLAATARKLRHAILLFLGAISFHLALCALGIGDMSPGAYVRGFLEPRNLLPFFISNPPYHWLHLWFLGALVYIYLFALVWFGDGRRLRTAGPLGAVLLVCMTAFQEFAAWLPFDPVLPIAGIRIRLCVLFLFRGLPFFLLGIWLRSREGAIRALRIPAAAAPALVAAGAALAVLEALWTAKSQFYVGNHLMTAGMFLWAIRNPSSGSRPLAFVGKNLSMPVYIVHPAAARWVGSVLRRAGAEPTPWIEWATPLFVVLLSLALACAFHVATARFRPRR